MKTLTLIWANIAFLHCVASADIWDLKTGFSPVLRVDFSRDQALGFGLSAYAELGLTESLSLASTAGISWHENQAGQVDWLSNGELGLLYGIDVLEIVPFFGIRMGWLYSGFGITLTMGIDYLWTDTFFIGLAAEAHEVLPDLSDFPNHASFLFRIGYRLEH